MAISICCTLRRLVKLVKLGEKEGGWEGTCFPSVFPPQLLMVRFAISIQLNRIQNQNGNEKFPDRKARNDNLSSLCHTIKTWESLRPCTRNSQFRQCTRFTILRPCIVSFTKSEVAPSSPFRPRCSCTKAASSLPGDKDYVIVFTGCYHPLIPLIWTSFRFTSFTNFTLGITISH